MSKMGSKMLSRCSNVAPPLPPFKIKVKVKRKTNCKLSLSLKFNDRLRSALNLSLKGKIKANTKKLKTTKNFTLKGKIEKISKSKKIQKLNFKFSKLKLYNIFKILKFPKLKIQKISNLQLTKFKITKNFKNKISLQKNSIYDGQTAVLMGKPPIAWPPHGLVGAVGVWAMALDCPLEAPSRAIKTRLQVWTNSWMSPPSVGLLAPFLRSVFPRVAFRGWSTQDRAAHDVYWPMDGPSRAIKGGF